MQLTPDFPVGKPSFVLSQDEIATVVDLVCRGARGARATVTSGLLEVPITIMVRKAMRQIKKQLGITNLEIRGEHELEDMSATDHSLLGRIDITLKFLRQFGDEDDYVAIECKRIGAGSSYTKLNGRYVSEGVIRFYNGQYAGGHAWGFMLGYVLALPAQGAVRAIGKRICNKYGVGAKLAQADPHPDALAIEEGTLIRLTGVPIRIRHIFVDMTSAA